MKLASNPSVRRRGLYEYMPFRLSYPFIQQCLIYAQTRVITKGYTNQFPLYWILDPLLGFLSALPYQQDTSCSTLCSAKLPAIHKTNYEHILGAYYLPRCVKCEKIKVFSLTNIKHSHWSIYVDLTMLKINSSTTLFHPAEEQLIDGKRSKMTSGCTQSNSVLVLCTSILDYIDRNTQEVESCTTARDPPAQCLPQNADLSTQPDLRSKQHNYGIEKSTKVSKGVPSCSKPHRLLVRKLNDSGVPPKREDIVQGIKEALAKTF